MKRLFVLILAVLFIIPVTLAIAETTLESTKLGDVNGDFSIDEYDYILVKRHHFETRTLVGNEYLRADVNRDQAVDTYDYILIRRHYFETFKIEGDIQTLPEESVSSAPEIESSLPEEDSSLPEEDSSLPEEDSSLPEEDSSLPEESDTSSPSEPVDPNEQITVQLTAGSQSTTIMAANTAALQKAVDEASANGGGTLYIPAGTYYFSSQGSNKRGNEEFVCMPKDNVTIIGAGKETVLQPVGRSSGGLDMFYFNEYADSGFTNPQYLVNADFYDFIIDGALANADRYTSAGKGFMINLYKDCDWRNVIVKNTDGTGFGMDCPINCTIIDCKAYNCGKLATTASVGASGFGIGTGYSENETLIIKNCYAEGNKKFGVFFEHQGRFCGGKYYTAKSMESLVVDGCTAKNNYIDFGGELAVDVTFKNCTVPYGSTSYNKISFTHHSIRCNVENMNVECRFDDVTDASADYYDAVYWAVNVGLTTGIGNNLFGVDDGSTHGQMITFLYRALGYPGELKLTNKGESAFYENALAWAVKNNVAESSTDMTEALTKEELIEYIWKFEGSPEISGSYSQSINWAISEGLIDEAPSGNASRTDVVKILYDYLGE
ncbi:MAG: S-layer homology domain-containing protein [Clostridia bacterium]|nr:S-layer homology domain-containing protein [Clostridia bacterium]